VDSWDNFLLHHRHWRYLFFPCE